jgi:hypothetical protein
MGRPLDVLKKLLAFPWSKTLTMKGALMNYP